VLLRGTRLPWDDKCEVAVMPRHTRCLLLFAAAVCAPAQPPPSPIADHLTANALKADVSFLASDALEGRGTPSRGLDIAGEFVAAQFRRAGLEPAGDDRYFQTATMMSVTANGDGLGLELEAGGRTIKADSAGLSVVAVAPLDLSNAGVFLAPSDRSAADALTAEQVGGRVLVFAGGRSRPSPDLIARLKPALVIRLVNGRPGSRPGPQLYAEDSPSTPTIVTWDAGVRQALADAKPGPLEATVSVHIPPPAVTRIKLRNVVGVLRGSDPALKGTYLLVTAHYDHLGTLGAGEGDRVFNGANDDASGTASVIEIANALAGLPQRPRRTIVFIALFGEEIGGLGSQYYAHRPLFPLAKTVADINLEQLGRTDDVEGPRVGLFNLTGFDFTDLGAIFRKADEGSGIKVVKDEKNSDPFFARSDNAVFADAGVPSTTVSVGYIFPDYHRVGDEWQKLDYENMASVDRAIALGIEAIADSEVAPHWNAGNPAVARFIKARR
jgi:hypothetical protein